MRFTVAIDGPAAAGKGTIGKAVAARFGFAHLDTGLLYRAVGAKVLAGIDPVKAAQTLAPSDIRPETLRSAAVADAASRVAANAQVRAALEAFQRYFARRDGGAVLDGRDIGTVICPQAEVKLYITASAEVRAARRHAELIAAGAQTRLDEVLADVRARDSRDSDRAVAPLRPAADALIIDTTGLGITDAVAAAVSAVEQAMP